MTATSMRDARLDFHLPQDMEATSPPEHRGISRDQVRLLVAGPDITHTTFRHVGDHLRPGDLLVFNTTPTMAAALDGHLRDRAGAVLPVVVHLSTRRGTRWEVELRRPDGRGPVLDATPGEVVALRPHGTVHLLAPAGPRRPDGAVRLWTARLDLPTSVAAHLEARGRPVSYAHRTGRHSLSAHQTAFARLAPAVGSGDDVAHGASAEMASAGRPFTPLLVTDLVTRGVVLAPITLHAGVSSLDDDEAPRPEPFEVPSATADLVTRTRHRGGRVVAVGTTVTRALETVAVGDGRVAPGRGWTDLVLGPRRPARVVDGLVTGWHAPRASHLLLLEAVAGRDLVERAYEAALAHSYLWHEFGDSCLLLP